jgi:hypothetical protein
MLCVIPELLCHGSDTNAAILFPTVEAEKAGRDGRSAEELYRRVQRLHEEQERTVQAALKELAEKLEGASKGRETEAARRAEALEQLRESRASAEKLRVTVCCFAVVDCVVRSTLVRLCLIEFRRTWRYCVKR